VLYYWLLVALYAAAPRAAYRFSELVELHAHDTYEVFAHENEARLKSLPPPLVAAAYYRGGDAAALAMFDAFQEAGGACTREERQRAERVLRAGGGEGGGGEGGRRGGGGGGGAGAVVVLAVRAAPAAPPAVRQPVRRVHQHPRRRGGARVHDEDVRGRSCAGALREIFFSEIFVRINPVVVQPRCKKRKRLLPLLSFVLLLLLIDTSQPP